MRRDTGLLPQPVRTAQMEITGTLDANCVRSAPSNQKSAPAATAREARCISVAMRDVAVGEDDDIDVFVADDLFHLVFFEDRNSVGIKLARQFGGITASAMSGIWVAVKATTWNSGLLRKTTLKLWKSLPAAPRMSTLFIGR